MAFNEAQHKEAQTDFGNKTTFRRWYWKGDHSACKNADGSMHADGVCHAGQAWGLDAKSSLIPVIVPFPTDKRHRVQIEEEGDNATGDVLMGHQAKGFVALEMETAEKNKQTAQKKALIDKILASVRPSDEIADVLRERGVREIKTTAHEEKWSHEMTTEAVKVFTATFNASNVKPAARGKGASANG